MATIPTPHSGSVDYPSAMKRSIDRIPQSRLTRSRWELRVNARQLTIMWSVVSGLMFIVFLFGFYAGRERGLTRYLEENAREPIRLPILAQAPVQDVVHNEYASIAAEQVDKIPSEPTPPAVVADATPPTVSPLLAANDARASLAPHADVTGTTSTPAKATEPEAKSNTTTLANVESAATSPATPAVEKTKAAPAPVEVKKPATAKLAKVEEKKPLKAKADSKSTTAVQQDLSKGWYVQLAAKKTVEEAMAVVKDLNKLGLKSVVQPAQVRNTNYYRVLSGPYTDKKSAQASQGKLTDANLTSGSAFLKEVQ